MNATTSRPTATVAPVGPDGSATEHIAWLKASPFLAAHLVPLAAFFVVVTWQDWVLCAAAYLVRMFFITAGYHRYLAHRTYRMGRVPQFLMALGGTTAVQKGPLWWAGHHRIHHRFTDLDGDVHSPRDGFWWSHVGWILSTKYKECDLTAIKDFAAYPELRFLERCWWIGPVLLAGGCFLVGGWGGLVIGFFLSTVLLWHATFLVNSAAHLLGRRRFATPDTSRNSLVIALLTGGEGWHNNHHYLPSSSRQGFAWWEVDATWYVLRVLSWTGVVHGLKDPPARLLDQARVRDGAFDIGMFRSYWERAARIAGERIADLSARPLAASAEGQARPLASPPAEQPAVHPLDRGTPTDDLAAPAGTPATDTGDDGDDAAGTAEPRSNLAGLISRVLESANQLAASTRRTRRVHVTPNQPASDLPD